MITFFFSFFFFFSCFDVAMTVEYSVGTDLRQQAREGYLGMFNILHFLKY